VELPSHRYFAFGLLAVAGLATALALSMGEPRSAARSSGRLSTAPKPPRAPRSYRPPRRGLRVHTSAGLARALSRSTPQTIVLADGSYRATGSGSEDPYFVARTGHRLYARKRGRAVLEAGIAFGGNSGAGGGEVHGLTFDIADERAAEDSSAVHAWGRVGVGTKVLDTTFRGHGVLESAIRADQVERLIVRRVTIRGFRRYGVFASDNDPASRAAASLISDVNVRTVRERTPGSEEGRAEYGVWIGNRVRAPVARIRIRDFGWAGLWTGNNANDVRFTDLDIDGSARAGGNAVYIEHKTRRNVFERFHLGPNIKEGFVSEWDYGTEPTGAGIDNVVRDGVIDTNKRGDSKRVGVFADQGTVGMRVSGVKFLHADYACIVNLGRGTGIGRNDYRRRAPGAAAVSTTHP
jgi:hypothetical protein